MSPRSSIPGTARQIVLADGMLQAGTGGLAEGGGFPAEGIFAFTQRVEREVAELLGWLQQVQPIGFQDS